MSINAYPSAVSVIQGETIDFHISSSPPSNVHISIARIGVNPQPTFSASAGVEDHPMPPDAYEAGCGWPPAFTLEVPADWPSALYRADFRNAAGESTHVGFVVKSADPATTSPILFQFSTSTEQAYSEAGGKSLYPSDSPDRARKVSFNRPGGDGYGREIAYVYWLERNGFPVEYCTSVDIHESFDFLERYQLLLSLGHDEYWSKEMRDNVEAFIESGGNVAFFTGNTCWWQVRFEDDNRTMVCYKNAAEDPLTGEDNSRVTVEFTSAPVLRPENSMTGISFLQGAGCWGNLDAMNSKAYQVRFPQHWVFEGTGLTMGSLLGEGQRIVGYETDAAEYTVEEGIPRATGRDGTPPSFVILATADLTDWGPFGKAGHATMGIFRRTGTVFNAATTDWHAGFLVPDSPVHQITRNVITRLREPYPGDRWEVIGTANDIVALGGMMNMLFAATAAGTLWWREPIGQNVVWAEIGDADQVVALAGGDSINSNLSWRLFAVTDDGRLLWREPLEENAFWEEIGDANDVVTLTAANEKLFAATSDNQLLWRNATGLPAPWEPIDEAPAGIVDVAAMAGKLLAATSDDQLWWRDATGLPAPWEPIGNVPSGLVAMTFMGGKLFAVNNDNLLSWRDPPH